MPFRSCGPPRNARASVPAAHSRSRRSKAKQRLTQTIPIRQTAKGYPSTQCNSGMWSKFRRQRVAAKRIAAYDEIFLKLSTGWP